MTDDAAERPTTATEAPDAADAGARSGPDEERAYSGLLTAFPYAFRASDSRLFRAYAVLGGLVALLVAVFFAVSVVRMVSRTASLRGGFVTLSRTGVVLTAVLVFLPTVAPVLLVARRYRRDLAVARRYDAALALAGAGFVAATYVGLVISVPPAYRSPTPGPVAALLYGLPAVYGLAPPLAAALLIPGVHYAWRRRAGGE